MDRLAVGMHVYDVADIPVGVVTSILASDWEVERASNDDRVLLRADAIFNVDGDRVTLICNREDLAKYTAGPAA